jgi:hypothetical protein
MMGRLRSPDHNEAGTKMTGGNLLKLGIRFGSIAAVALAASSAFADGTSNKWRIEVDHNAHSQGEIVFRVVPKGADATDVTVTIANGTHENDVAKAIRDAFKVQLSEEAYEVEVDDGEDVLVKKRHGAADFGLTLVSSTVENVKFDIDKE